MQFVHQIPKRVTALLFALVGVFSHPSVQAQAPSPSSTVAAGAARHATNPQRAVDELSRWVAQRNGQAGVAILDVASGRLLAQSQSKQAVNPASNAKLLTAAAALSALGPDFTFTTELRGSLRDGRLADLVLTGHGDPSLTASDLSAMCASLVAMGLRRIDGRILVDQSRFDAEFVPPAFNQQPDEWAAFRAPVSAVALERNTVTLNVVAAEAGDPARIWFHPAGFVQVAGKVSTREAGSGQAVTLALAGDGSRLRATVGGHVAAGLPRLRFSRRVDDPRLLPGYVLAHLLVSMGVEFKGEVALGAGSVRQRLVWHRSEPLAVLLQELGKHSDNFYAEMIFKTLGAEAEHAAGRSRDGAKVVLEWLRKAGAAASDTVVTNGSGLFDANRASPLTLARALRAAYRDPAIRAEFVSQLAVGGVDGTLRSRFRRQREARRVRAKTGTLASVDALSGYVLDRSGAAPTAFSIVLTRVGDHREARRRIDRVVDALIAE